MALKTRYTNVGGQVAAVKTGGQRYFVEPDALGNVRGLVNQSGVRSQTYTYWPYGEVRTSTGSVSQPLQFCGTWGYYTESSTKQYVRARYYMQSIGRWQTVDPLWPNEMAYGYAEGDPTWLADPSGMGGGDQRGRGSGPKWPPEPSPEVRPCLTRALDCAEKCAAKGEFPIACFEAREKKKTRWIMTVCRCGPKVTKQVIEKTILKRVTKVGGVAQLGANAMCLGFFIDCVVSVNQGNLEEAICNCKRAYDEEASNGGFITRFCYWAACDGMMDVIGWAYGC